MIVILSCYFLIEKSITPCDVELFFSFCDCEPVMLTETENRLKQTETEIQPKPIGFQLFRSVSVGNFTNQKFRFRLAKTKKTDQTELITPLASGVLERCPRKESEHNIAVEKEM